MYPYRSCSFPSPWTGCTQSGGPPPAPSTCSRVACSMWEVLWDTRAPDSMPISWDASRRLIKLMIRLEAKMPFLRVLTRKVYNVQIINPSMVKFITKAHVELSLKILY
ncbi:hypothetical protein CDAR_583831 [Caerostris darwini]|uniref:Uncharacterized protein n=1 Tax=Caerostris darwini TaxID=1538125 RepID=A0AAV4RCF9_9ARAC|nr:hypothetical protein CDAR_583831 [Caerostris darwini]